ncbi:MAG: hypothetical protein NTY55_11750, partial [Flavobacteriia bacterium]|nr:hypothetical protein [Flavobacteriia bacterium]
GIGGPVCHRHGSGESTSIEGSNGGSGYGYVSAYATDGFTLTTGSTAYDIVNRSGDSYVSWNWLGSGTTPASNTSGTVTSTVSVNATSGFSIVGWTPPNTSTPKTIGHGLGVAPSMMIVRNRKYAGNWRVYHKSLGATKAVNLNTTDSAITDNGFWENTTPTSTVFTTGNGYGYTTGGSTDDYIAYCFAEVKGFSKFGSYTGNNSLNNFVYTGFKPAFVMIKVTSTTEQWCMKDNKRNTINPLDRSIFANANNAEDYNTTNHLIDFVSNGFNLKDNTSQNLTNGSGQTYAYMAFAESPFVSSKGIPTTAR